jgi:4-hydroxybenzoate polyprenyltransferase
MKLNQAINWIVVVIVLFLCAATYIDEPSPLKIWIAIGYLIFGVVYHFTPSPWRSNLY